jgi:hypothetical protein
VELRPLPRNVLPLSLSSVLALLLLLLTRDSAMQSSPGVTLAAAASPLIDTTSNATPAPANGFPLMHMETAEEPLLPTPTRVLALSP